MSYIKVDTVHEGALRAAIRFACAHNGTPPNECYEVIGRKILNGEMTAICASWHDHFVAYYCGATDFCSAPPDTSTESGLPDPALASITDPSKPTKPLIADDMCQRCREPWDKHIKHIDKLWECPNS